MEIEFSIVFIDPPERFSFNLYTTESNINIEKHCAVQHYGQLNNEDLYAPLRLGSFRNYLCNDSFGVRYCKGKTVMQDFKSRNIGFSLGYGCDHSNAASLKGVSFNISVSGQMNKTDCVSLHHRPHLDCVKFYPFASFPNLLGHKEEEARHVGEAFKLVIKENLCYKFHLEMLCYVFLPRCDVTRRVTIPPCRETCWDFENCCLEAVKEFYNKYDIKTFLNCNYLPTVGSDIKCFSKAVTCDAPPKIPNGKIEGGILINGTYPLHTQLNITCVNETFIMKGNNTITCQFTGLWSQPPQCVLRVCPAPPVVEHAHIEEHQNGTDLYPWHTKVTYICNNITFHMQGNSTVICLKNQHWSHVPECVEFVPSTGSQKLKTLEIVLPTVVVVFLTFTSICLVILYKRKLKIKVNPLTDIFGMENTSLTRKKKYDVFVCYQFDTDDVFVKNTIIPNLETKHDEVFKLFIAENDFEPGYSIIKNMQTAIQNSNSAILVMSQGFVDSMWCQQEFEYCHIEHMKDPAFKLFVIMMQPVESLQNLTECMKQYFVQETYLKKDDEKLFTRIASYLTLVKQHKNDEGTTEGIDVNLDEDLEDQDHHQNEGGVQTDDTQNEAEDANDVHVIVHSVDDVSSDDDNQDNDPLL